MSRPSRIRTAEYLYHVTSRGVAQRPIFRTDADRRVFLATLGDVVVQESWRCHAHCLMDNHYHLLLETPNANLPEGMRDLNGTYATRFNVAHGVGGHVFQGRYDARIVRSQPHALEVARYIPLNPVRAGLCHGPADWPWSSYRATAGITSPPAHLATDTTLGWFGGGADAPARFRAFVASGRHVTDPEAAALATLLAGGTLGEAWTAHHDCGYSLRAIGTHLGVNHTTLSRRFATMHQKGSDPAWCGPGYSAGPDQGSGSGSVSSWNHG